MLLREKSLMSASGITAPKEPAEHSTPIITCGTYRLDVSKRTYVMGIVNVTPDSFSDGGKLTGGHRNSYCENCWENWSGNPPVAKFVALAKFLPPPLHVKS